MKMYVHLWQYVAEFFIEWAVSYKICRENQNTHLYSITFLRKSCRLWDNMEKYGIARQYIQHICIACWITKATDTHSEYVILTAFPWQQWLRERASVLCLYEHCLSCFSSWSYWGSVNISGELILNYYKLQQKKLQNALENGLEYRRGRN
jgi:hypothetical protein